MFRKKISNNDWYWDDELYDYIGWKNYIKNNNALYYGNEFYQQSIKNNIFRKNKFVYVSNNENYKQTLPGYKKSDIVVLQYDSDLSILSFSKDNDNGKLNSCIKNLPKDEIFYWFVGHSGGKMSLTVVS